VRGVRGMRGMRGDAEATPLTRPADANAHDSMAWGDRVVFPSDGDDKNGRLWLLDVASGKDEILDHRATDETPDVSEVGRHQGRPLPPVRPPPARADVGALSERVACVLAGWPLAVVHLEPRLD
jgi:hypothetical protein